MKTVERMSLEEAGKRTGVSRQRAHQLEQKALKKFKEGLKREFGPDWERMTGKKATA